MAVEVIFLLIIYIIASIFHYYSKKARKIQERLFDPYLQFHNVWFDESAKKEKGAYRILCLGGSTTDCEALPVQSKYPAVLQAILQKRYPLIKIEVLNAGRSWYATKHSLINYATYYHSWDPDLVILMHGINDLYRSFSPPRYAIGDYNSQWLHFYGPAINAARQYPRRTLEQKIWKNIRAVLDKLVSVWRAKVGQKTINIQQGKEYPLEKFVSIKMFEKHLRRITHCVKNDKRDMLLISQPSLYKEAMDPEEINTLFVGPDFCYSINDSNQKEFPDYQSLLKAMKAFNGVTKRVAFSENVLFTDAADRIPKDLHHFMDDGHYKEPGAKALAQEVAETVVKANIVDRGPHG